MKSHKKATRSWLWAILAYMLAAFALLAFLAVKSHAMSGSGMAQENGATTKINDWSYKCWTAWTDTYPAPEAGPGAETELQVELCMARKMFAVELKGRIVNGMPEMPKEWRRLWREVFWRSEEEMHDIHEPEPVDNSPTHPEQPKINVVPRDGEQVHPN
jgi:hypothetical protein